MRHARADYNRIQDPAGKIPENEPVMLFRAQDKHFIKVLEYYKQLVKDDKGDYRIPVAVDEHIHLAKQWPFQKAPDL